jgi:hypothetical protein
MPEEWPERPIARVNTVDANSPASEAVCPDDPNQPARSTDKQDLRGGDLIYSFAGVTAGSAGGLQTLAAVVQRSEGVSRAVKNGQPHCVSDDRHH